MRAGPSECFPSVVEAYVAPDASIIDWSGSGVRVAARIDRSPCPLVPTTIRRIQAGLDMLGQRSEAVVVPCGGTWNTRPYLADQPLRTQTGSECEALAIPPEAADAFVLEYRNHAADFTPVSQPIGTVTAQGNHHGLVIPYRKGRTRTTDEPLLTMATHDSAGLARPAPSVEQCFYRMLSPREQLLAQRFPRAYKVHGNQAEQTMQAGNAVPANVAQWLGDKAMTVLA